MIPTYREAENLRALLPRIDAILQREGIAGEVIVVDDNSPDDTRAVCDAWKGRCAVRLEVRTEERGLSSAVVHGMRRARGALLIVMDADLSHPPESLPDLVDALRDPEVDFVIGSRYVRGGATDESWGLLRRLNSRIATAIARPLTNASDPMAGFFGLRRALFVRHEAQLNPIGYKIGLELLVKCGCRRIVEVPIVFRDRLHGESKLTLSVQWQYLRHVGRLLKHRYPTLVTAAQFGAVGLLGTAVDFGLMYALLRAMPFAAARAVAIAGAMTFNFVLNRTFTFESAPRGAWRRQYVLFCASCLAGAVVNWGTSVGLAAMVPFFGEHVYAAAGVGVVAGFALNFVLSSRIAFAPARR